MSLKLCHYRRAENVARRKAGAISSRATRVRVRLAPFRPIRIGARLPNARRRSVRAGECEDEELRGRRRFAARPGPLQFATTSIYHFLFVPLTIGLAFLVAGLHTAWYRTGNPIYLRATRFCGTLLLINFAIGVVTGIVQEFQFGMNWSSTPGSSATSSARPLAIEGLLAFFLESTFLGLWIFGWDRLPSRCTCLASGSSPSAPAARRPSSSRRTRGCSTRWATLQPVTGRAELTSIWEVLTNTGVPVGLPHGSWPALVTGALVYAGRLRLALLRRARDATSFRPDRADLASSCWCRGPPDHVRRERARRHRGATYQPDEDGRRGGAVEHLKPRSVLALPDRRTDNDQTRLQSSSVPACCPSWPPARPNGKVEGINQLQAAVRQAVRAGELHAQRRSSILVDARHGLSRPPW